MEMQISDNTNIFDQMKLGKYQKLREKILRETPLDIEKVEAHQAAAKEPADVRLPSSSLKMDGYMIPENEGKIKHMCLTASHLGGIAENYLDAFKTFLKKMPGAKFTVLASDKSDANALQSYVDYWGNQGEISDPRRVNIIDTGKELSIWAQDSTLVVGNKAVEQDRMWFPGAGDGIVASELAKANPEIDYMKMEGRFVDGGNQRATKDKIFAGIDVLAFMLHDMKKYPTKYYKIAGNLDIDNAPTMDPLDLSLAIMDRSFPYQKMEYVGHKGEQPSFHIDMAVTPLGKKDPATGKPVMVVGDPKMAIDILDDLKKKDPIKYREYEANIKSKISWSPDRPLDKMIDKVKEEKWLQENFDAHAKGYEQDGYKVERVPYLGSSDLRGTPWFTYNNSVIDGDNIFIPNFDIPELDDIGNDAFRKYGYNPVPIDFTAISSLQGAINCIAKVVEREYK